MAEAIRKQFGTDVALCGVATAGIAIGALVADEMGLPFAYCRPKPKEHGMQNQLEGRLDPSVPVIVIEDLISTGGSSLKVVEYLRGTGFNVQGMAAIFTYGFDLADANFKEQECPFFALSDYAHLLPMAIEAGVVSESDLQTLESWRSDPANWMK